MHRISEWSELCDEFTHCLIVGNGGSIAVHRGFLYHSLFAAAKEHGYLTPNVAAVFDQFKSSDFELVLRRLWHAKLVNKALVVENSKVAAAYLAVRTALIETVRSVHVTYEDATPHLRSIATFMQHFRTVASLNYDLVTYWAAMIARNDSGHAIKDGFIHEGGTSFTLDWKRLRERIRGRETTMLFYPHGNLVLARLDKDEERKIVSRGDGDLLHTILETWTEEKGVPIFVCEGTSEQKKHAVQTSSYLGRVYREVFNEPLLSLAIYGWGIGGQEQHILDRIEAARPARVAVSVLGGDQTYANHAYQRFSAIGVRDIRFFDAASAGAWNNPA
jgi:hypothetical protein